MYTITTFTKEEKPNERGEFVPQIGVWMEKGKIKEFTTKEEAEHFIEKLKKEGVIEEGMPKKIE